MSCLARERSCAGLLSFGSENLLFQMNLAQFGKPSRNLPMLNFGGNRMLLSAPTGVLPGSPGTREGTSCVLLGGQERARGHVLRALLASPLNQLCLACWE